MKVLTSLYYLHHASVLLFNEISLPSIARRLGHATVTTTQETYIHIIKELEVKDNDKIMSSLGSIQPMEQKLVA